MVFDVDDDDDVDDGDDSAIDKLINEFVFVSGKPISAFLASLFGLLGRPLAFLVNILFRSSRFIKVMFNEVSLINQIIDKKD